MLPIKYSCLLMNCFHGRNSRRLSELFGKPQSNFTCMQYPTLSRMVEKPGLSAGTGCQH